MGIILKHRRVWNGYTWLKVETMMGPCEHGNELSASIKGGEFLN
jgi:hypothetical protein